MSNMNDPNTDHRGQKLEYVLSYQQCIAALRCKNKKEACKMLFGGWRNPAEETKHYRHLRYALARRGFSWQSNNALYAVRRESTPDDQLIKALREAQTNSVYAHGICRGLCAN
ncbi:MAG: hypothetical protein V1879_08270 [Pseudomonadota bacterium]